MSNYKLTDTERDYIKVIKNEMDCALDIPSLQSANAEININVKASENLLLSIGYKKHLENIVIGKQFEEKKTLVIRSFENLLKDANQRISGDIGFEELFSSEELVKNREYIKRLNNEFDAVHAFDSVDIFIPVIAGILGGAIDCLLGGFAKDVDGKNIPGTLSAYIRSLFDRVLSPDKISELERAAKVTFDAQDNRHTTIFVSTLSSHFHRFLQLGHDPILGFVFGVMDMVRGTMTTIDYNGKFVIQLMDVYKDKKAAGLFEAIAKVFLHMLSDVNTPAGLPVPFMAIFNKLKIGSIGEENQNIAELVKSMYGQGYDFRHFCSMSISVMVIEVIVRVSYFAKRWNEGHHFVESLPVETNHIYKPKLGTMLFIAHSVSTAINSGKVVFTRNPLDINYAQWLLFALYSVKQLKWALYDKPRLRDQYVTKIINSEWSALYENIDKLWNHMAEDYRIVYE